MDALTRRDALAGLAAAALGLFVIWTSLDYRLGTPMRMGPGMFPLALGIVLTLCGLGAAALGRRSARRAPALRIRAMLAVTAALALFALSIERLGFIPAAVILIFVAGLAERPVQWRALALLAAVLAPAAYALFALFLGLPTPAFAWGAP